VFFDRAGLFRHNLRERSLMANDMMSVWPLVEKSADADLLREMIGFAAERLMELEVGSARVLNSAKRIHCGLHSATATVTAIGDASWNR